jgi:hypothetical protein
VLKDVRLNGCEYIESKIPGMIFQIFVRVIGFQSNLKCEEYPPFFATFGEVFQNRSGNRFTACIQQKLLGDFKKKGHMSSSQNNTKKRAPGMIWLKSKDKEVAPTIQLEDYFAHLMSSMKTT